MEHLLKKINMNHSMIDHEYFNCISDLIVHQKVKELLLYVHHGKVSVLEHSLHVSYRSYQVSKSFGLDYRSAARGGLLHDFFLYDWHVRGSHHGLHGFHHAKTALQNACQYFNLNDCEKDIIRKHMWPLNIDLPKYRVSYVVMLVDKYCAVLELVSRSSKNLMNKLSALATH